VAASRARLWADILGSCGYANKWAGLHAAAVSRRPTKAVYITDLTLLLDKFGALGPVKGPVRAMAKFQVDLVAHASNNTSQSLPAPKCFKCKKVALRADPAPDSGVASAVVQLAAICPAAEYTPCSRHQALLPASFMAAVVTTASSQAHAVLAQALQGFRSSAKLARHHFQRYGLRRRQLRHRSVRECLSVSCQGRPSSPPPGFVYGGTNGSDTAAQVRRIEIASKVVGHKAAA
jgi:hypothetical protein